MLLFRLSIYLPNKVSNPCLSDADNTILRGSNFPLASNSASNSLIGDILVLIFLQSELREFNCRLDPSEIQGSSLKGFAQSRQIRKHLFKNEKSSQKLWCLDLL